MLTAQVDSDYKDQTPPINSVSGDGAGLGAPSVETLGSPAADTTAATPADQGVADAAPAPGLLESSKTPPSAAAVTVETPSSGVTGVPGWASSGLAGANEFVQLLARAVHQFHTYPPTSPFCLDVIAACHKGLAAMTVDDTFAFCVTPDQLMVGDRALAATPTVSNELIRRLHRAQVAEVTFERGTPVRDLSRFCIDVSHVQDAAPQHVTFAERLVDHGVSAIEARMAHRPEVLEIGTPAPPVCELVSHERLRRQEQALSGGPVHHLYPPDKGWVRMDPTVSLESVSLVDLAIIVDDPAEIAAMLMRLTGENPVSPAERDAALEKKFTDVAAIFAAADPRLARVLFAKLARTVLNLDPNRRKELLKQTILPGLLDGRVDGSVLADFPDLDLAEALCLLLDLETAAPEVLSTALDRLALPEDRRKAIVPLLNDRLQGVAQEEHQGTKLALDRYAHKLLRIEADEDKSFAEYTGFDLSMDAQSAAVVDGAPATMAATDTVAEQIACLRRLVRLEPDPRLAEIFLERALSFAHVFETSARWGDLAGMLHDFRQLGDSLRESRPDVADAVAQALTTFCTVDRATELGELHQKGGEARDTAALVLDALGPFAAEALARAVDNPGIRSRERAVADLMADHAAVLAPSLALCLDGGDPAAPRAIIRVLGLAGPGHELVVIRQLKSSDESTGREALRALARMGTPQAASAVAMQIEDGSETMRPAAEEALGHFPQELAIAQLRKLLGNRDFVLRHPQLTGRLMDRATGANVDMLAGTLEGLVSLRFRFWNTHHVRIAHKAQQLLQR